MGSTSLVVNRTKDYTPISDELYPQLQAAGVIGNTAVAPNGATVITEERPGVAIVPGVHQSMAAGGGPSIAGVPQKLMDISRRVRKVRRAVQHCAVHCAVPHVGLLAPRAPEVLLGHTHTLTAPQRLLTDAPSSDRTPHHCPARSSSATSREMRRR